MNLSDFNHPSHRRLLWYQKSSIDEPLYSINLHANMIIILNKKNPNSQKMKRTLLLPLCLCFLIIKYHVCIACHGEEREALLSFKNCKRETMFKFHPGTGTLLSSVWKNEDCCMWEGVSCSNRTGHVTKLSLPLISCDNSTDMSYFLRSFSKFSFLQILNLNYSSIKGPIPQSFASLKELKYLDMSASSFNGTIPSFMGNLTNLEHLDLSGSYSLEVGSLKWLSNLTSLQYIDLSNVRNSNESPDWYNYICMLPNLRVLQLGGFNLTTLPSSFLRNNLSSISTLDLSSNRFQDPSSNLKYLLTGSNNLVYLDLSYCRFNGTIPGVFENLPSLMTLLLRSNSFMGTIPAILGNLCNLITLDLSYNQISGDIPDWIWKMRNLEYLDMSNNQLNGSLPTSLAQLSNLVELGLGGNSMQGVISEALFQNMTKLEELTLNSNKFTFNISSTWIPPFQLQLIDVGSCSLGPKFPCWLRNQRRLAYIDISGAKICDVIPSWLWNISFGSDYLNISDNRISGTVNVSDIYPSASVIDLSSNLIQGPLPHLNSSVTVIFLYDNLFSGHLQPILKKEMIKLREIVVSHNNLTGEIPYDICEMGETMILDLSYNKLTGEFPNCPKKFVNLNRLNLASNNFHGSIPQCIYKGDFGASMLRILKLRNNNFSGEIPPLDNALKLILLDFGYNKFTGNIPTWIGVLDNLRFLSLRANKLNGSIPSELSHLPLQFLDLGNNELSGFIPPSLAYLSEMKDDTKLAFGHKHFPINIKTIANIVIRLPMPPPTFPNGLEQTLIADTKGLELEYSSTLTLVRILDLSDNKLTGVVPIELMNLTGLQTLNLSRNMLTGVIPYEIGAMEQLETLDLSRNHLSGEIPNSLSLMTKLNHLNLSYNNLSGRVPTGNQLQTLNDPSIYFHNNPNLCGSPLPLCYDDAKDSEDDIESMDDDSDDMFDLYLSMGIGYGVGLWFIGGVLIFVDRWRIAYFRFLNDTADKIFLMKEIVKKRILRVVEG